MLSRTWCDIVLEMPDACCLYPIDLIVRLSGELLGMNWFKTVQRLEWISRFRIGEETPTMDMAIYNGKEGNNLRVDPGNRGFVVFQYCRRLLFEVLPLQNAFAISA